MTRPATGGATGLGPLKRRLAGGAGCAAQRARPRDWELYDKHALADHWPADVFSVTDSLRLPGWDGLFTARDPVGRLASHFDEQRELLLTTVLSPADLLTRLGDLAGAPDAVRIWIGLCWAAEAAWRVVTGDGPGPGYPGDRELLRPLAARLRFLVLSEPMRTRGYDSGAWWSDSRGLKVAASKNGLVDRAFGADSWHMIVARCREARYDWRKCLDSYQSQPLLALAHPAELEQELIALVFRDRPCGGPLVVSVRLLGEEADLTAEDASVISDVTEQHLLPRFQLPAVASLARFDDQRRGRVARVAWAVAAALAGAGAVVTALCLSVHLAAILAASCYVIIGIGVVLFGSRWAALWLLRQPAASTVGLIALVSLISGGWLYAPRAGWEAFAVLVVASFAYLVVLARNHRVAPVAALRRSAGVTLAGMVHALLVSLIGLTFVAPAFDPHRSTLNGLWQRPGCGHAGMLLLLATAWCLAVGVFSQILWDDRPITAPLAHLQWRSGR